MTASGDYVESGEELLERGGYAIDTENWEEAIAIGERLRALGHAGAHEVLAVAHMGRGNVEGGMGILEAGLKEMPDDWGLWCLLGTMRTEAGDMEGALEAFDKALACPNAHASYIHLQYAIALLHTDRMEEVTRHLELIDDPDLQLQAVVVFAEIAQAAGAHEDAIKLARETIETAEDDDDPEVIGRLHALWAASLWEMGQDPEDVLELLMEALSFNPDDGTALELVRDMDDEVSDAPRCFRLVLEGDWPEDEENNEKACGFSQMVEVVADDESEAFEFARRLEPKDLQETIRVRSCEEMENAPDSLKGVYRMWEYELFPKEK